MDVSNRFDSGLVLAASRFALSVIVAVGGVSETGVECAGALGLVG